MKKDVVVGLGEIGSPILKLFSKTETIVGYDLDPNLMNMKKFKQFQNHSTSFLHIAIPVNPKFQSNIIKVYKKFFLYIIYVNNDMLHVM